MAWNKPWEEVFPESRPQLSIFDWNRFDAAEDASLDRVFETFMDSFYRESRRIGVQTRTVRYPDSLAGYLAEIRGIKLG